MKKAILGILVVALVAVGFYVFAQNSQEPEQNEADTGSDAGNMSQTMNMEFQFGNPKKSAHYETNTPAHGAVLAAPPINIVIDFNFDLAAPSSISVKKDGIEYATGELVIDANKLSMRRNFSQSAPDGLYRVEYLACWPDRSCHDGNFEFAIDRSLQTSYEDLTGRSEVTIRMSEISFAPKNIKISSGTKVTWINDEAVEHYVNTDSHPAHTYFPSQNSRALKKGESYSSVFDAKGAYPYHCSAHANTMTGNIVVV